MLELDRLTAEQHELVVAPDGPRIVLAGPGCGKTTVLAARLAYLVAVRGVEPASLLAMTFTRGAAGELRERLIGVLGQQARQLDVGTFHSLGLRMIRQWQEELGFGTRPLTVYPAARALEALREVAAAYRLEIRRLSIEQLAQELERFRLDGSCGLELGLARQLAQAYEELLVRRGALDFPAMLALPLRLLRQFPEALQLYQGAYRYVCADELQDVSPAQYALLRQLCRRHRNLLAVGDLAQTLYQFRDAGSGVLKALEADFPEAELRRLNESIRATRWIVAVGNSLAGEIPEAEQLWTSNPPGPPPVIQRAVDASAEASFVAGEIRRLTQAGLAASLSEVAILYRTNAQVEDLAVALRQAGIRYRIAGQGALLAQPEVQDVLAYLRLVADVQDGGALARIVNVPPRGLAKLARLIGMEPCSAVELLARAQEAGDQAAERAGDLCALLEELRRRSGRVSPSAVFDLVLDCTGYGLWLAEQPGARDRFERLAALRRSLESATDGLEAWLAEVEVRGELESMAGAEDAVQLSSIHRAKGQEWRIAFIAGFEDGLIPHAHALESGDPAELQAELRVAYVALTRARERLYITHCAARNRDGMAELRQPSRFLRLLRGRLDQAA